MEKFLEFLAVEGCEYEIKDGAIRVLDTLEPYYTKLKIGARKWLNLLARLCM